MTLRDYETALKAASDPTRARILKMLEGGELCVCQIIAVLRLSQSTVSRHLFLLRAAGFVLDRKDRKWIFYSLVREPANPFSARLLKSLRKWLNDDPVIAADRERLSRARELGPEGVIAGGMKFKGCGPGCDPQPGRRKIARR
ncbi:MAG TPA: metalloregulator ArsR/SmtB family transcription factor [Candidatus Deferrimicrobiaceae bacterium]